VNKKHAPPQTDGFVQDIQIAIENHFSFLVSTGFALSPLLRVGSALSLNYRRQNTKVVFSFEFIPSTAISATINNCSFLDLAIDSSALTEMNRSREATYEDNWQAYLATGDSKYLDLISTLYAIAGKEINEAYVSKLATLLRENLYLLSDDVVLLSRERRQTLHSKIGHDLLFDRTPLYRCTYTCFAGECYFESRSLEEVELHLSKISDEMQISDIAIFDSRGTSIPRLSKN
jgi:hypothetical protein